MQQTSVYAEWYRSIRDQVVRGRITVRIERVEFGNFGDVKGIGGGVQELRMTVGLGYRIHFTRRGERIILLLCGGDQGSQSRDIARAKQLASELE